MPHFTIETAVRIPNYHQRSYEAPSAEAACRLAIEDDDWSRDKLDYERAGEAYVTEIWAGTAAYRGDEIPVPSHFRETEQHKAEHFGELVKQLEQVAQPKRLSRHDFERWLPDARAAVAKAKAILEGRRDPAEQGR